MTEKWIISKPVNLIKGLREGMVSIRHYFRRKYQAISHLDKNMLLNWAAKFNVSQWCYFVAIFLLLGISVFSTVTNSDVLIIGFIAFIGLFREMWNLFQRVWEHNIGKAFVLVVYAATANFALAFAAVKINEITGIEPRPFVFTLGFTTLVMLPFWITISNVVLLLFALILANLLLFISIPFKLIGIRLPVHWEDQHRAGTTMLLRIVLIPLVIYSLFTFISPYLKEFGTQRTELGFGWHNQGGLNLSKQQATDLEETLKGNTDRSKDDKHQVEEASSSDTEMSFMQAMSELNDAIQSQSQSANATKKELPEDNGANLSSPTSDGSIFELETEGSTVRAEGAEDANVVHGLIADFIFYFESYAYSACQKQAQQHSVIIDENLVLLITPDDKTEVGYRYEVQPCVPVFMNSAQNMFESKQSQ